MADLRVTVEALGYTDVATYIQSGNVLFSTDGTDTAELATTIEGAIAGSLGVRPQVVVLLRDELARVVAANPYRQEPNPKLVHAVFFGADPGRLVLVFFVHVPAAARNRNAQSSRPRPVILSRTRSTRPAPGARILFSGGRSGALGCGRVGAIAFIRRTFPPSSSRSSAVL